MRREIRYMLLVIAFLFAGCDTVYEYPGDAPADPNAIDLTINVELDLDLEFDCEQTVNARSLIPAEPLHGYKVRLIVEVYPDKFYGTDKVDPSIYQTAPAVRQELVFDNIEEMEKQVPVQFKLLPDTYIFLVWADYISGDSAENYYYDAGRLHTVQVHEPYTGNTRGRDVFASNRRIDLRPYSGEWNVQLSEKFILHRPLAKYELITSDINEFFGRKTKRNKSVGALPLNDYRVKISYRGYFPMGFDALTDRPDDAKTGIAYDAMLTQITDTSAVIAFDHVLTNGTDSFVAIDIKIYDGQGNLVNEHTGIQIPYRRNVITKVYGNFLTKSYGSGVVIDPGFEGEFNIYL